MEEKESRAGAVSAAAALNDLDEKLSKLKARLEQVLAALHTPAERRLLCHDCGLMRLAGESGWTLRLCADDELHAFCPNCDERHFNVTGLIG